MNSKECLVALMLAGFSASGTAQIAGNGLNCQGLVGAVAAQCMQGVGSGAGRAVNETVPDSRTAAGSESARASVGATGGVATNIQNLQSVFSSWSLGGGTPDGLNCQGLVGAAAAQCLQGVGSGAGRAVSETARQDGGKPAGSESARAAGDAAGGVFSSVRNFFSGLSFDLGSSGGSGNGSGNSSRTGPKCEGLVGSAMAQCLQGVEPVPGRSASVPTR